MKLMYSLNNKQNGENRMMQILFETLIRTIREYVREKKKYIQKINDIQNDWEYSDIKKGELVSQTKTEFDTQKEKFIEKFTSNINSIKKTFHDKQKDYTLDNNSLYNAMFFIESISEKDNSNFTIAPELIENIVSEFIGDTRSLNMLMSIAESNKMNKTIIDKIKKYTYSDADLDSILEEFIDSLDGETVVDYVATKIKKVAYKCGITLDDCDVHDEIGTDTLMRKAMGLE